MNKISNLEFIEEIESKIKLLSSSQQNAEFAHLVKGIVEYVGRLDVATTESKILTRIFPAIETRLVRIFTDNYSFFATLDDDLLAVLVRENLEVVFQLTEIVQELLHYIYEHTPVEVTNIESLLKYVPKYVQLFADHWKNSCDEYKNAFMEEISRILEVVKHLYGSFLCLLERSISLGESENEIGLLSDALTVICDMPKALDDIDPSTIISSWKCFRILTIKYSSLLENSLDIGIPLKILTEEICQIMEALFDQDPESFRRKLKLIRFLTKILFEMLTVFYHQLSDCAANVVCVLMMYVKVLSFTPEYHPCQKFSGESMQAMETEVFKNLDDFLRHLILGQTMFKDYAGQLSDKLKSEDTYKKYFLGFLILQNKILQIICDTSTDWSGILINLIEDIFDTLPYCQKELFLDAHDGDGIYQQLIINISVAILLKDVNFQCTRLLIKRILQNNVFVAVLALEVYTLVVSNIPAEECLSLLVNLLYGVEELMYGFFSHRPEIVYLKCLLQRMFRILPDTLKEQVIKLFRPDQLIQIWRFLGFNSLPPYLAHQVVDPVMTNTLEHIGSINQPICEDTPQNIAEGLELISTVSDLNTISNNPRYADVVQFMEKFWSLDIGENILKNNVMKYFVFKICALTVNCIQNSCLSPDLVFPKLKLLILNNSYGIAIFKIISQILNAMSQDKIPTDIKQGIIKGIAETLSYAVKNNGFYLQELCLEMLKKLNESHKETLNMILDSSNANVANRIFEYTELFRNVDDIYPKIEYLNNSAHFTHVCLEWSDGETNNDIKYPSAKRFKNQEQFDYGKRKQNVPVLTIKNEKSNKAHKIIQKSFPGPNADQVEEADDSASEVINRIKGEIKCLTKLCKTEKLTQKNVANLRIIMSQMSSLM